MMAAAFVSMSAFAGPVVSCSDSSATIGNAGYISCQGPVFGNIATGQTHTATFSGYGTFNLVGTSNDLGHGPFSAFLGTGNTGTLNFDSVVKGYFVLGIKGGPDYSLYLFNGGTAGISSLSFDTFGVVTGSGHAGPGLSHLALFTTAVPEPETYAMLLAGLGLMGTIARRRKNAA